MKYRSRPEIQACILEAAKGGASKTRLMYKAFLSYFQVIAYMKELLQSGMLEYDSSEDIYRTSSKGIDFLGVYQQLEQLVS
jgi:predicted transcriptional regulator